MVPNGPELRRWPGAKVGIDWRPKFRISWPSTTRMASRLHEVVDLLAQPQRMDVAVLDILVGAGRLELGGHAVGQRLAPVLEAVGIDLALHAGEQLVEHASAVADDADVDLARRGGDLVGVDVDARDLGAAH